MRIDLQKVKKGVDELLDLMGRLNKEQMLDIFRDIAGGKNPHGDFLTHFAEAVMRADEENFELLLPAALRLIQKYELDKERFKA